MRRPFFCFAIGFAATLALLSSSPVIRAEEVRRPDAAGENSGSDAPADAPRVGRKIDNFELPDFHGKARSLDDMADARLVVVAFLGTDCPLVKLYGSRLGELALEYAPQGVAFLGINANQQDSITEIAAHARQHGIKFPILKDRDNQVADRFGALRTPEVFVLDGDRVVRYWGRVDDQFGLGSTSGYAKENLGRRDLAVALDELLAGKDVSQPVTKAPGCLIGRVPRVTPHGDVTYSNQVARILQNRCVECHRPGEAGPFSLTSYEEAAGWGAMIREVVHEGRMPPWFANPEHGRFSNDARLTDEEKKLLDQWVENGTPEGDPQQLPPPRQFTEGWRIQDPDVVLHMSEEPYQVQAEGVVDYQFFSVPTGFTEDKWIQAAECRPGNRAVVHHIIAFVTPPGGGRFGGEQRSGGAQLGYAPGMPPRIFPPGMAMKIPAGSNLVFQMHYTPNGTPQEDRSYIGLVFADPKTVKQSVQGSMSGNVTFRIPPGDGNHVVRSKKRFRRDTLLLSLLPHMHLRGKSFRYDLVYPDGKREVLLDVPHYDFNWQLWYELAEPKLIPKGSRMECTAVFDNSTDNPFNPNPKEEVTWGEQTWEEMMFGFYSAVDPHQDLQAMAEPADKSPSDGAAAEEAELERKQAF